jgi:hypothetical protein
MCRAARRTLWILVIALTSSSIAAQSDRDWRKAGFTEYEIPRWKKAGISLEDAIWFAPIVGDGFSAPQDAAHFTNVGLTPEVAKVWLAEFASESPGEELWNAAHYLERGISLDDARPWRVADIRAHEIDDWLEVGLNAEQASEWLDADVHQPPRVIRELLDANFDPQTYRDWYDVIKMVGIKETSEWVATGVGTEVAKKHAQAGVWPDLLPTIAKQCPNGVQARAGMDSRVAVYLTNPYDVEGQCYMVIGRVQQLLGRTAVLGTALGDARAVIHVEFAPRSAPTEQLSFLFLGKGRAPFRYTAVNGSEQIVPNLIVLAQSEDH